MKDELSTRVVKANGFVVAAGGDHFAIGTPPDSHNLILCFTHDGGRFPRRDVPDSSGLVERAADDLFAIWTPGDAVDSRFMALQDLHRFAGLDIPNANIAVHT